MMNSHHRSMIGVAAAVALLALGGCPDDPAPTVPDDIFAKLGEPIPSATAEQKAAFERGIEVGLRRFTPAEGFGPSFNASFCLACHDKPVPGGASSRYRNFHIVGQRLSDGSHSETGLNGVQQHYNIDGTRVATDAETNVIATRNPIAFFGVGLLAEVDEDEILRYADPDDADGDGISGRPNYDRGFVGRFGRKAQTVSIEGFVRGPIFNHLGITTIPLSDDLKRALPVPSAADLAPDVGVTEGALEVVQLAQAAAPDEPTEDDDGVDDPEMGADDLFDIVSMTMLMAPPAPDADPSDAAIAGRARFEALGCASCHVPALRSPRGLIPAYTDMLLHDMGDDLADGIPMKVATGREFRTQPLWGVVATAPYLHDGRADTLDDAIRLHGGEGERARDGYVALSEAEQGEVIAFLESLGGRDQRSAGLLPPAAPIPDVGDFGGPTHALSPAEEATFLAGRAIFDRDTAIAGGLGPIFNGDACRSCHFDPVIGGAGPNDVNVVRHGYIDPTDGAFTAPASGQTIAHHQGNVPARRVEPDPTANYTEQRQTPPLFGLGLIDRIPEATIVALEDPGDANGDGISGRAHRLPDGRIGRLGWKAQVPSVAEFSRDASTAELGLSVAPQAGLTFGAATDDDDAPDPELSAEELDDMTAFVAMLAPPPRTSTDPTLEAQGEGVFSTVGCDGCHVPELMTEDNEPVRLFSDLLLHDVASETDGGIVDGNATVHEFRTSPLWGLAHTAPYMHDGRASSVEEAIAQHAGEAEVSVTAALALSEAERAALIAFLESL